MSKTSELQTGTCRFCGQVHTVNILGDDPVLLDQAATEACDCQEAQSEKRKAARAKKVDEFLKDNFDYPEDDVFIRAAIDAVESWDSSIKTVTVETHSGWKHKITSKDLDLVISSSHTEKKGFKP